jgi:hypothetical protein
MATRVALKRGEPAAGFDAKGAAPGPDGSLWASIRLGPGPATNPDLLQAARAATLLIPLI